MPRLLPVAALALGISLLWPATSPAQTMTDPNLQVTALFPNGTFSQPTTMAFLGPNEYLVLEKATGLVRRVLNGVVQPTPALDANVHSLSERGMLGIAIDPGSPPRVFLYFTETASGDTSSSGVTPLGNRVYRYDWNAGTGTLINPQLILDLPVTPGPNHDGGVMLWDDVAEHLYVVIGDLNRGGQMQNQPSGAAADNTGGILRVNADGTAAAGNPFTPYCSATTAQTCSSTPGCPPGETCRVEVARYFAYGVRNCFGMAFDPSTGAVWMTENGPGDYDEINRVDPGFNSGWSTIHGPDSRDSQNVGDLFHMPGAGVTYSDPEFSWFNTVAPTGILFPVGSSWGSAYDGVSLVGDSNNGQLYSFPLNGARDGFTLGGLLADLVADTTTERNLSRIGQGFSGITHLVRGPEAIPHVYVVSIGGGTIYRISGPEPLPTLAIDNVTQAEGNTGTSAANFTVTLSAPSAVTVSVNFATANATATSGSDYAAVSGTLTFVPGDTSEPISVMVNGDTTFEPAETFHVNLSGASQATIADGQGVGTLANDDAPPPAPREYVSVNGNDANQCSNPATPCRTFVGAIAQVLPGGEVVVLDSGTFGGGTITKSVTLNAPGVAAVVATPIEVNAGPNDVVTLRGLSFVSPVPGSGTALSFYNGAGLNLERTSIHGWNVGVSFTANGRLNVVDSEFRDNASSGISLFNGAGALEASVERSRLLGNGTGLEVLSRSRATVKESLAAGNTAGLFASSSDGSPSELAIEDCTVTHNGQGVVGGTLATVRISGSTVSHNSLGLWQSGSGVVQSRGGNTIEGNGTDTVGTIGSYPPK
jgi:glucose/arabinose dehydrogenase